MPVYNAGSALRQAVAAVLAQSVSDFELIVVDDASTDGCTSFVETLDDPRVRLARNASNRGPAESRNYAIALSRGRYIAIADADDLSSPMRLSLQVKHLESHPRIDLVAGACANFTGEGDPLQVSTPLTSHVGICLAMRYATSLTHSSVMMRRDAVERVGGYRSQSEYSEDYDLYVRLVMGGSVLSALPDVVVAYRVSESSVTHSFFDRSTASAKSVRADYRDQCGIPSLRDLVVALRSESSDSRHSPRLRLLKILGRVSLGRCGAPLAGRVRCGVACFFAGPRASLGLLRQTGD